MLTKSVRSNPTYVVNPSDDESHKTVVVLGAFRGGTSMVARVLQNLGVFMGDAFAPPDAEYETAEDCEFQTLLHRPDLLTQSNILPNEITEEEIGSLRALIEKRNREHRLWGWKYPGSVMWCLHANLEGYLRNPHFITVFRDPLAVFQHELDKSRTKPARVRSRSGRSFSWVGSQYQGLIEHVVRSNSPHLLVSYERAVVGDESVKESLVDSLIEFLQPALANPHRSAGVEAFR
jgi:hypothetical protein